MSKKKLKKLLRKALKNGAAPESATACGDSERGSASSDGGAGLPKTPAPAATRDWLNTLGLPRGAGASEQFVIGALVGAGAAYVLADEKLRGRIMKSVMRLYTGLAGSVEEFKEQIADLKAEIEAEQSA
ncbi:MAG: YtxH domain-containing protein [Candidatus Accumulibacter sp.]|jgi:hypothetical protein|nr:YtxH domain-containing protein [Accumulibacter sp.]